ncbi:sulfite--cytochrome c oxidoreductase subunit A [Acidiphilium multivorum AIU301]|uniref:Sulfite--cytochrome c oxidoreductase subunit A n=1 Tax=Acidiphilium multivorum (strain DSM 11245 / JCM 8867 / NBRC 100883 / AIU 301) TaxID=926570 RepID=F0J0N3_ACIMA|nr:molybdopterin-dependent oxidoreductase [Acidiphilium multivorum]BAJ81569.1 sulfite--cytochrome c oxidoreductase subunit A [Acidiphilium multivorum AIU301]GAN74373.1 sulfite--cytochrome c oxidoreductase subunit A [Acidiphilium multivorum AIU301]
MKQCFSSEGGATRRATLLGTASIAGLALASRAGAAAPQTVTLPFANGERPIVPAGTFPQKGEMILQRTRAPLLETPFEVFRDNLFTPNDRAFVRWHMADFPESIDTAKYRIRVSGLVDKPVEITLDELMHGFPIRKIAAVNQCSGNSRGFIEPRVPGAQWAHGAMYNAMWTGVPLRHLLARAGVKAGATHVAFRSLEQGGGLYPADVRFEKAIPLSRANDGEVMIAFQMNGANLPLLNGYPVRLIVPGWYSTYWVKMLTEIEVMDHPSTDFWMATAYKIPDTPTGSMTPGEPGIKMVPINEMKPRSFFGSVTNGARLPAGRPVVVRGFAFGGGSALKSVAVSIDGGASWRPARLGQNHGAYGFRDWQIPVRFPKPGAYRLMVRATNAAGHVQPAKAGWNPGGFLYNAIEHVDVTVA